MTGNKLPGSVIEQDHALEKDAEKVSRRLMELRWHWTLDESNAQRVGILEYANSVGKAHHTIQDYAKGWLVLQELQASRGRAAATGDEARKRAHMSTETETATEAVAKNRKLSFAYTHREFGPEVRHVREIARQRAEEKGTSTIEEIPQVAEFLHQAEHATITADEVRRQQHPLRYIEIESALMKARRHLLSAAQASESVDFDAEERELLRDTIDNVKRLLHILDRAIANGHDKSWVSELRLIEGGIAS